MLIVRASYIVVYKCSDHMGNFICNTGRIYDELPFFQGSLRVSRSKDDPRTASIPQELHRRVMRKSPSRLQRHPNRRPGLGNFTRWAGFARTYWGYWNICELSTHAICAWLVVHDAIGESYEYQSGQYPLSLSFLSTTARSALAATAAFASAPSEYGIPYLKPSLQTQRNQKNGMAPISGSRF